MRKTKIILSITILVIIMASVVIIKNNSSKFKNDTLEKAIEDYYSKNLPENKGELKINTIKEIDDGYLALVEKNYGEGEPYSTLFLLNKEKEIVSMTSGNIPISPGFSVNSLEYNDSNIIFGTINDSKMNGINEVGRIGIDVSEIKLEFTDGEELTDKTIENRSYIMIVPKKDIKDILLYNSKNELQDRMSDYDWGNFINNVKLQGV
ncbi:hypothetical protein [Clostridium tertium]|uniref:Uncharacterized protein n=1 Tax=Clostridium tertium TaxID=1559 RepID=A0A6N3E3S8_9CLOT